MKPDRQNRESGTEIGNSLEFDFVVPPAVKADEISVVEPTQPLRLTRQSKNNKEARTFVPASLFFIHAENILTFPVENGDFKGNVLQWKQIDRMEQ
ncbi:hypothetical protein K1I93_08780 [Streptococcus australis]|uniref:hypothetical protein n=1 Tax=Streptococcus australis TaxID=113107 RepID=UPI001CBD14BA|nr:hypothetical protein [Streptococcus australis]MBZ2160164.1 hypothetical protein [Streptococcus australis]